MGLLEVKSVEWRIDQAASVLRRVEGSQRSRLEVFRSHDCSQCLFEWSFWRVIAICHLWFGARFGDVSELWDAPTSTDLLLRVMNFKRVLYIGCLIMRRRFVAALGFSNGLRIFPTFKSLYMFSGAHVWCRDTLHFAPSHLEMNECFTLAIWMLRNSYVPPVMSAMSTRCGCYMIPWLQPLNLQGFLEPKNLEPNPITSPISSPVILQASWLPHCFPPGEALCSTVPWRKIHKITFQREGHGVEVEWPLTSESSTVKQLKTHASQCLNNLQDGETSSN